MMEQVEREFIRYKMEHYTGSLDFPCIFCGSNSYDNLHFSRNEDIFFVVCKECIDKEFSRVKKKDLGV